MNSALVSLLTWYLAAVAASAALVPLCRRFALGRGYVAHPREDRWHREPTALLGGVAIALATLALATVSGDLMRLAVLPVAGSCSSLVSSMTSFRSSRRRN